MHETGRRLEQDTPNGSAESGETPAAQRFMVQKKALAFRTLAILWIVPSLTALFVLPYDFRKGDSLLETLKLVRVEQWLALLLLLLHPFFIYFAIHFRRTEIPREQIVPNAEEPEAGSER